MEETFKQLSNTLTQSKGKLFFVLLSICFLLYGNSIGNDYALDDDLVVTQNDLVKGGVKNLGKIFSSHYTTKYYQQYEYRPMVIASFAIEKQLFGLNPHVSHFLNIILYACILYLLYLNLNHWFNEKKELIMAALFLFAFHPIHSEVVNNIKCRDELLAMLFSLWTGLMTTRFIKSKNYLYLFLCFILALAGLVSKLSALPTLVILLFSMGYFQQMKTRPLLLLTALFAVAFLIFYYLKNIMLGESTNREFLFIENPLYTLDFDLLTRTKAYLASMAYYYKIFLLPFPLVFYYGFNMIEVLNPSIITLIISSVLIIASVIIMFYGFKNDKNITWAMICFLIGIFPFTNFFHAAPGIVAERFLFPASIGGCVLLAIPLTNPKYLKTTPLILLSVLIVYGGITITRNKDWKNLETLVINDIKNLEQSAKANAMLGFIYYEKAGKESNPNNRNNYAQLAINHYQKATEIYPDYKVCYNNIGALYISFLSNYAKGEEYLQKAISIDSTYLEPYKVLVNMYETQKQFEKTLPLLKKVYLMDSTLTDVLIGYTRNAYSAGKINEAINFNTELITKNKAGSAPYINLANIYLKQGDTLSAINNLKQAQLKSPNNNELANFLKYLDSTYRGKR